MRLAWFTPLPPSGSGVARYNAEVLPAIAAVHQIELFVDTALDAVEAPAGVQGIFSAHDFVWKHHRKPYDLVVYQMGNAPCHDYQWAYCIRYPGLMVLHDGQVHHARALSLLLQGREDDYREEFCFNHPDARPDLAELGIAGLLGSLTYLWPMRRILVEASRQVVVHNEWLAEQIQEEQPDTRVSVVEMGVPRSSSGSDARRAMRARHGIPDDAVVFAAFGNVTPEKRIPQIVEALAAIVPSAPRVHLLLVGAAVDHYDPLIDLRAHGLDDRCTITGYVPHDELDAYFAASDVCLCLRWPTSRETSAAWLRCLAAGKPTIVTDLVHMADIASLDPRSWTPLLAPRAQEHGQRVEPASVSLDLMDEVQSLQQAMRRLATDEALRELLGARARRLWAARFTLDAMASRYLGVIEEAAAAPLPDPHRRAAWPAHFLADGTAKTNALLQAVGLDALRHSALWQPV